MTIWVVNLVKHLVMNSGMNLVTICVTNLSQNGVKNTVIHQVNIVAKSVFASGSLFFEAEFS